MLKKLFWFVRVFYRVMKVKMFTADSEEGASEKVESSEQFFKYTLWPTIVSIEISQFCSLLLKD